MCRRSKLRLLLGILPLMATAMGSTPVSAASAVATSGYTTAATAGSTNPAFLTLLIGRGLAGFCFDDSRVFTLDKLSAALQARGVPASAIVVLNRTGETQRICAGGRRHGSWADWVRLHNSSGWDVVSEGNHLQLQSITTTTDLATRQKDWDETCGSLDVIRSHGLDGSGLYAYAGGPVNSSVQTAYVSKCFSYGRHYRNALNKQGAMGPPWFQYTRSLSGGRCNDTAAPCYTKYPAKRLYDLPSTLAGAFNPSAGQWSAVQNYNLVSGTRIGVAPTEFSWDCSAADPRLHWTSKPEVYCASDYLYALDHRGAGVTVTTPLAVARAWGRSSLPGVARPTGTSKPPAPTGVAATPTSSSAVRLTWNPVSGATSYKVSRAGTSGGPYNFVAPTTNTAYLDSGLTANKSYFYVVQAVNSAGTSANSAQTSALTRLNTPSGVTATAVGSSQVDLSWGAVSGATEYRVVRGSAAAGPFEQIAVTNGPSYSDTSAAPGSTYFYGVSATSATNSSDLSALDSATTPPAAPMNLTASPQLTQIDLRWEPSNGATAYHVLRSDTSGGPYTEIATTTDTTYSDTGVTPLTQYFYVVRASDSGGSSGNSNEASATTTP